MLREQLREVQQDMLMGRDQYVSLLNESGLLVTEQSQERIVALEKAIKNEEIKVRFLKNLLEEREKVRYPAMLAEYLLYLNDERMVTELESQASSPTTPEEQMKVENWLEICQSLDGFQFHHIAHHTRMEGNRMSKSFRIDGVSHHCVRFVLQFKLMEDIGVENGITIEHVQVKLVSFDATMEQAMEKVLQKEGGQFLYEVMDCLYHIGRVAEERNIAFQRVMEQYRDQVQVSPQNLLSIQNASHTLRIMIVWDIFLKPGTLEVDQHIRCVPQITTTQYSPSSIAGVQFLPAQFKGLCGQMGIPDAILAIARAVIG